MGVYLPNVDMPKDDKVVTIQICPDGSIWQQYRGTVPNAKAVPVPPHGKLVEVADVKELFEKHFGDDQIAFQLIDSVPVIIPPKSKEQQDLEDLVERLNREGIAP